MNWKDYAWITITPKGGANMELAALTSDISINWGDKDIEVKNLNTGQLALVKRRDPIEISFDEVLPRHGDVWNASYEGVEASGTKITVNGSLSSKKFRIVILWTDADPSTITSATQSIPAGKNAKRLIFEDFYFTGWEENWKEQLLTGNATFKGVAVDSTGNPKIRVEGLTDQDTDGLAALGTY